MPAATNGPDRNIQQLSSLFLGHAFIEDQIDYLSFLCRQSLHTFVELSPLGQILRYFGKLTKRTMFVVSGLMVRVVIPTYSMRTKVLSSEVNEFAADLNSGEVEEMANTLHFDVCQGPVEPDHGSLENIVGLHPPA